MLEPRTAVIVVAAGSGTRLGLGMPKALVQLAGQTLLERALGSVFAMSEPAQVVVVAPADNVEQAEALARSVAGVASEYLNVVAGGATRQESVRAGLGVLLDSVDEVLVHDAARALTPASLFDSVVAAVRESGSGVLPVLPIADTIKEVDDARAVVGTLDRSRLAAAQTPQGFPRAELVSAYFAAAEEHTDDASLFAAAGHPVITVDGDQRAFKVTTVWDLRRAESYIDDSAQPAAASVPVLRTGIGVDVHAFDDDSPLWLGGIYWPGQPGLAGHSDGDALSHAVCDALLSAAGLGDIGGRFGTADDRFAGAHGDVFIAETVRLVTGSGFAISNVAVQIIANRPKLASRRTEIEQRLTQLIGAPVSVSATTSDGLGFTGRGEGVTAIATALVQSVG
ncbi:2-C-methyl-D-erythritol 4-phosphate cytidylyltransferase [Salinibacterium hongtaonis]|uniref:Bifunctional enzyme IspD/IspF n=1 Tax=Homoserinimonas hongtaonis TaxID=2079791 RepID=A0A2U1T2R4_9MICO|nr:2-C-methyl-D-erythritol 4-phosphate cytidylyltransferase [Salinibacterium hongtaonis]PWB98175.1 bifunctional 2-C-methyl-D-erythritol 4-phosphate cytidylyltransferase/2-C-methyl-D-erythritol 2,4-cyclodiphosphate synthase [Salinibacterium hongtaonis]